MKILVWEMRTSKGFTLMELSKKSGIGKSTINNIENGKVSPTLFQLEMIAIALGVKITDLFESHCSGIPAAGGTISTIMEINLDISTMMEIYDTL